MTKNGSDPLKKPVEGDRHKTETVGHVGGALRGMAEAHPVDPCDGKLPTTNERIKADSILSGPRDKALTTTLLIDTSDRGTNMFGHVVTDDARH